MGIDVTSPQTQSLISLVLSLVTLLGLLYGLITAAKNNRKTDAEARKTDAEREEVLSNIALALIEPLEKKVKDLEKALAQCEVAMEGRVKSLLIGIRKLTKQLREHDIEPAWEPKEYDE